MKNLNLLGAGRSGYTIREAFRFFSPAMMLATALVLVGGPALAKGGACTRTADTVLMACQHEVKDDFLIRTGYCINLSDADARARCEKDARTALQESKAECGAQFKARLQVCGATGEAPYDPQIDPSMFVDPAEIGNSVAPNPYFPLIRGTTWVYKSDTETITVTVTEDTKVVQGVTCAVIHDVVEEGGQVTEDTLDFYAQDIMGTVRYFGENTQVLENGEVVSIAGSFEAGVDGAKSGIIMEAAPAVGDAYRQEFSLANAEDIAEVVNTTGSATAPAASCKNTCVVTKETTPLEPGVIAHKVYAPDVGTILELEAGVRTRLVKFTN